MKAKFLNVISTALGLAAGMVMTTTAQASIASELGGTVVPTISAGAPPDTPAARVDANTPSSDFSGVVSINIRYNGLSYICSGTLVSSRDVVTAGHCVDTNGQGTLIDLTKSGNDVRVVFNSNGNVNALITATSVSMNPNYQGFGNCPTGVTGFCLNDDVAVIHLGADAPSTAKIYGVYTGPITEGMLVTMVGYGTSGDGINGYTISPSFTTKRVGQNRMDLFDLDDEQNFAGGKQEVWYADFDGGGLDPFCDDPTIHVCTGSLPNDKETIIGGGDSGGPSFVLINGKYYLAGNNTFSSDFQGDGPIPGAFGNYFGGMVLGSYIDYLEGTTGGVITTAVPEPETYALMLAGLVAVGAMARRRQAG